MRNAHLSLRCLFSPHLFFTILKIALLGAIFVICVPSKVSAVGIELFPTISPTGYVTLTSGLPSGALFGYREFSRAYDGEIHNSPYPFGALGGHSWDSMFNGDFTMENGWANGIFRTPDGDYWIAVTNQGAPYIPDWSGDYYYWRASRVGDVWSPTTLSFVVSTTSGTVSVRDYISPEEIGTSIGLTISKAEGGVVHEAAPLVATTTGDLYYTWNYPSVTDPKNTKPGDYIFYVNAVKDGTTIRQASKRLTLASKVEGYPAYSNFSDDAFQYIYDSYSSLTQTLGTGLSGALTQVDLKTSNPSFLYYGSRPFFNLFECDTNTYGSPDYSGGGCTYVYSGLSEDRSLATPSIQSFYLNSPVTFSPSKYYFFQTRGNNQFNSLTKVYGSATDTVEGSCFKNYLGNHTPCDTASDLYFYLRGVTKATTTEPYGLSNVLFLPGLEASRLYKNRSVVCQINCEDQLWESNKKTDVEDLYLNLDGTSKDTNIYTRDAIKETNVPTEFGFAGQNIYKTFFDTLDSLTDPLLPERMARWEAYAYDWRQSVNDIVENGTRYQNGQKSLITTLENLVASSTTGKVTIIAHSNGGLLAKALLVKLQATKVAGENNLIDKIDVLILVASPQIGTAVAVPVLLHGYDQRIAGGLFLDEEHARELGRNMLGAYGLLPSKEYVNRMSVSPVTFRDNPVPSGIMTNFVNSYGNVVDLYPEYRSFLLGQEGRVDPAPNATKLPIKLSSSLLTQAETLHNSIDAWTPPAGLRVVEVAGWGLDTVASFEYYPKLTGCTGGSVGCTSPYTLDQKPVFTVDGDKTVVEPSAHFMGGERYWVDLEENNFLLNKNREHKDILEVISLNNFIRSIMQKSNVILDDVLRNSKPINHSNRLRISIHSPVSIGSYDSLNNFTGKVCSDTEDFCYIQEDIPNSSYLEFGEGKYINLPEENLQKVRLQGAGSGTFTFISEKVVLGGQVTTSTFTDIPVTTQTQGEVVLNTVTQVPELKLDVNGDGTSDFTLLPTAEFDPVTFLQIMKKTIESFDIKQARKNTLSKRIDGIIKSIQKGKIPKAQLKAERFQNVLKVKIAKPLPKKPKPQRLTNTDAEILIGMLETLLNNLEK